MGKREPTLEVTSAPDAKDIALVGESLAAFNESDVGPADRTPLAVFAREPDGRIVGGISGYTAWGWLFTQWLWVDETMRGKGLAGRMLAGAEAEAVRRGCHGAWIDTFNPIAETTYRRAGYSEFGRLPQFPAGRDRVFLSKALPAVE